MKRVIACAGLLGLLACSDADGQTQEYAQSQNHAQTQTSEQIDNRGIKSTQSVTSWAVDKAKSNLSFSGSQNGEAFAGGFSGFDADINFDPDNLSASKVVVTIDMNTADAGDAERTNALPGKEWFYVRKFPVAEFTATEFRHLSDDNYEAKGHLTIRDITQGIVLPFTLKIENDQANVDAILTINRSDYKIGTGMWASEEWVGKNVSIKIHLTAHEK